MNYIEQVTEQLVEHYARMALNPGWVPYARHQILEVLQKDKSGNWPDLYQRVKERMKEIENDISSTGGSHDKVSGDSPVNR